jgi:hypothetical protein
MYMVYRFRFLTEDSYFDAPLVCRQCQGKSKNGQRCGRKVVFGISMCYFHLKQLFHLQIKKSTMAGAGRGLFACNGTANKDVVFKKDQNIIVYEGEHIDKETLEERYSNGTAPYTIMLKEDEYIDSALERGVGSMANHKPTAKANCKFIVGRENGQSCIKIRAIKPIRNGDELFLNYGREYRLDEDNVVSKTYYKRPTKNT